MASNKAAHTVDSEDPSAGPSSVLDEEEEAKTVQQVHYQIIDTIAFLSAHRP